MTTPDDELPMAGSAEAGSQHDPEAAEAYAESVGIDPSPDEINEYLKMAGAAPLADQSDTTPANDAGA
ncbi:MAG: hypothetical protein WCC38_06940 [Pseudonocardiaceae bacterium]